MKKWKFPLPAVPSRAEFPLIFLLVFFPAYLTQAKIDLPVFDYPSYHGQILLRSLLIFLLCLYLSGENRMTEGAISPVETTAALAGLGGIYLLFFAGLIPLFEFFGGIHPSAPAPLISRGIMLFPAFLSCLATGTMEEFFFRGYAYTRILEWKMPPVKAAVFTNLIFAAGHLYEGLPGAGFALASGLFLSFCLLRGFSLLSLSAAHGLFNFSMLVLNYLNPPV